jgi:hypothetical protein
MEEHGVDVSSSGLQPIGCNLKMNPDSLAGLHSARLNGKNIKFVGQFMVENGVDVFSSRTNPDCLAGLHCTRLEGKNIKWVLTFLPKLDNDSGLSHGENLILTWFRRWSKRLVGAARDEDPPGTFTPRALTEKTSNLLDKYIRVNGLWKLGLTFSGLSHGDLTWFRRWQKRLVGAAWVSGWDLR